jgi:peptidoglycan hydrolase-like protein with peptidoglycan-binding domain
MIKLTDTKASIYEIQSALREISAKNAAVRPRLIPDGIYGTQTVEAVRSFQAYMGFSVTGVVDYQTWQALFGQKYK